MAVHYDLYLIVAAAARGYRAEQVRLNGQPVHDLRALNASGRLEFIALPQAGQAAAGGGFPTVLRVRRNAEKPGQPAIVGGFKSFSGMDVEIEIADPRQPGQWRTVAGRVLSVVAPGGSFAQSGEQVTVNCDKPQNRRVVFVPAERTGRS